MNVSHTKGRLLPMNVSHPKGRLLPMNVSYRGEQEG